jgi:hypothetical protein
MESTLRLFKALPVISKNRETDDSLMAKTIKKGFIFSPEVIAEYSAADLEHLTKVVEKELTLTAEQMNSSFHKSWKKVRDASIEQLVIEQILHYFTTYGFERLGIYNEDSVYIPCEELEIPDIDEKQIRLVVIRGLTKDEIKSELLVLLQSGIALAEKTIKDVIDVSTYVKLNEAEIDTIRNKEVRVALYDYLDKFPEHPMEFLRFLVYKATNATLLIKNKKSIEEIKTKDNLCALNLLTKYEDKYGLERLGEIFYRFKPLFLAFRTSRGLKTTINRIRKLAKKHHKPMPVDYLNSITSMIKKGEAIDEKKLNAELERVNTFRKIRLAYALKFRTKKVDSVLYRVRNGKSYATEFGFSNHAEAGRILDIVLESIAADMGKNVKGKKVYIPSNMNYTLPATEKQFTGYFPSGTFVTVPRDMIMGVHWNNLKGRRIDLDLSLISTQKIGWDSYYRNDDRSVLFSGDVTDARGKKGASELFYVKKQEQEEFIVFVNFFNYHDGENVPFKILVAEENPASFGHNYTVDPNNVVAVAGSQISTRQKILGLLVPDDDCCRFYFAETSIGASITSGHSAYTNQGRKYLGSYYKNSIELKDVLTKAGAELVQEADKADIDLSAESLDKNTILDLVK